MISIMKVNVPKQVTNWAGSGLPQEIGHIKRARKIGNWTHFSLVRKRWEASDAYQKIILVAMPFAVLQFRR
jgi:hypothetical protein